MLQPELSHLMNWHYHAALQNGIADDTPHLDRFIVEGVEREIEHRRQNATSAPPAAPERTVDQDVQRLDREVQGIRNTTAALAATPAALTAQIAPADVLPERGRSASPTPRRSMPISAPVSREVPSASGSRPSAITLSEEERKVARNSFTDPSLTNEERNTCTRPTSGGYSSSVRTANIPNGSVTDALFRY
jgi:hypothetical protein